MLHKFRINLKLISWLLPFLLRAHACDSCSNVRVSNGFRTIIICHNLFGIKSLPMLFISCTPECINRLLSNDNDTTHIPSKNNFIVNEKFIDKLKRRKIS